ncbi:hypothetical protein GBA52_008031 [Prunus armeniaca]|nr:hypothetical protein GBA52_008031 [Prunus armeniaca]
MVNQHSSSSSSLGIPVLLFLLLLLLSPTVLAKSRRPISDFETRQKKNQCYADIESGLWGWQCKSSLIAKENCALRCLSSTCYELVYESDPLEEGEKDLVRGQEFKYCMHNGLWGWQCKSSLIAKENCALRCLSSTCYELVYESDPLEEGGKDLVRGQEFKYCMHNVGGAHQGQSPVIRKVADGII